MLKKDRGYLQNKSFNILQYNFLVLIPNAILRYHQKLNKVTLYL